MSDIPSDLKFLQSHEWVREDDGGQVTVGISDHAQSQLGDLVFVELPEVGSELSAGDACAVVESVKAASDVYSPISGKVTAVNEALESSPEMVNDDPYGDGWLFSVSMSDADELNDLMDTDAYAQSIDDD